MPTLITRTNNQTKKSSILNVPLMLMPFMTSETVTQAVNNELNLRFQRSLNKAIDGVGLQLNYMINGRSYIVAGVSRGEVLSVNGGKVEHDDQSLFERLSQELKEETFGVCDLQVKDGKIYFHCPMINSAQDLEVTFNDNAHLDDNEPYKMCYLTFAATVEGLTLEQLNTLAFYLSPTAKYWNKMGDFLHDNRSVAFSAETFLEKWNSTEMKQNRVAFIDELKQLHHDCLNKSNTERLLMELHDLSEFKAEDYDLGLKMFAEYLDKLSTAAAFWKLKNETIGDFSERPAYHVIAADGMKAALTEDRNVLNINGEVLAKVFDSKTVKLLCNEHPNRFKSDLLATLSNLMNKAQIDIICDHDGTLMNSKLSETTRIYNAFKTLVPPEHMPTFDEIEQCGYGQNGIWFDRLIDILKNKDSSFKNYLELHPDVIAHLNQILNPHEINDSIVEMGLNIKELPGTGKFLLQVLDSGNDVAIFSGNWDEVVYIAMNLQLAKYNITCPAPLDKHFHKSVDEILQQQILPTQRQFSELDNRTISAFNDRYQHQVPGKPDPTGLLLQKFSLLLKRGVVKRDEIDSYLQMNMQHAFVSRADYRKSLYIGDDVSDLQAAEKAGFDFFFAVNAENSVNRQLMNQYIAKSNIKINIIFVENLEHAYDLLFQPKANARMEIIPGQNIGTSRFGQFNINKSKETITDFTNSEIKKLTYTNI